MQTNSNLTSTDQFNNLFRLIKLINDKNQPQLYLNENLQLKQDPIECLNSPPYILNIAQEILSSLQREEILSIGLKRIRKFTKSVTQYCKLRNITVSNNYNSHSQVNSVFTKNIEKIESIIIAERERKRAENEAAIKELCSKITSKALSTNEYISAAHTLAQYFNRRSVYVRYFVTFFNEYIRYKAYSRIIDDVENLPQAFNPLAKNNTINNPEDFALAKIVTDENYFQKALTFYKNHKDLLTQEEISTFTMTAMSKIYSLPEGQTLLLKMITILKTLCESENESFEKLTTMSLEIMDLSQSIKEELSSEFSENISLLDTIIELKNTIREHNYSLEDSQNDSSASFYEKITDLIVKVYCKPPEEPSDEKNYTYSKENCDKISKKIEKFLQYILEELQEHELSHETYIIAEQSFRTAISRGDGQPYTSVYVAKSDHVLQSAYNKLRHARKTYEKAVDLCLQQTDDMNLFDEGELEKKAAQIQKAKQQYFVEIEVLKKTFVDFGCIDADVFSSMVKDTQQNLYFEKYRSFYQNEVKLKKAFNFFLPSPQKLGEFDSSFLNFSALFNHLEQSEKFLDLLSGTINLQGLIESIFFTKKTSLNTQITPQKPSDFADTPRENTQSKDLPFDEETKKAHKTKKKVDKNKTLFQNKSSANMSKEVQAISSKTLSMQTTELTTHENIQSKAIEPTSLENITEKIQILSVDMLPGLPQPKRHFKTSKVADQSKRHQHFIESSTTQHITTYAPPNSYGALQEEKSSPIDQPTRPQRIEGTNKNSLHSQEKTRPKNAIPKSSFPYASHDVEQLIEEVKVVNKATQLIQASQKPLTLLQSLRSKKIFDEPISISDHVYGWYEREPKAFREKRKFYKDENDKRVAILHHRYPIAITQLIRELVYPTDRFSSVRQRWDELYQYPGRIIDYSQGREIFYDGVFEEAFDKTTGELSHHFFRAESLTTTMSNLRSQNSYGLPLQEEIDYDDTALKEVTHYTMTAEKGVTISETFFKYIIDDTNKKIKYLLPRDFGKE